MAIAGYKFDKKITIQQRTETQSSGEVQVTWTTFAANVWAYIEPTVGREYFAARQIVDEALFRITIRYIDGLTTKMRVSWNGDYYDIRDVGDPRSKTRYLELICRLAQ